MSCFCRYIARSAASTRASTVASPVASPVASATPQAIEEGSPVRQARERIGRRGRLRRLVQLRDPHRGGDLMRHRRQQILVLAAERGAPRTLDAERPDALIAELQRDAEDGADLARAVKTGVEAAVGDILELAPLDDPPADALTFRKALTHVRPGRADRRADHEVLAGVVKGE